MRRFLLMGAAALTLAAPAYAGGPTMVVGAAEDTVKQPDVVSSKAQLGLARLAGLDTVRVTVLWNPGETAPPAVERRQLESLAGAARLTGMRVIVAVFHPGSRTTPLTEEARREFAQFAAAVAGVATTYRTFVVGNEPNLNRFWLPQFNPDGTDAAAPAYLQLLAETYDALKAVSPAITVGGGAVSPRGIDRPGTGRDTHSPTSFIRDMGAAYRASGRTTPVMDMFVIHPFPDSNGQAPRNSAHPNSTTIGLADYGKLVRLLGEAFDGTAQLGSTLPVLYGEYGIQSAVPERKAALYSGTEPATTAPVDEATQAAHYREAVAMAFCQPTVRGLLVFHVADEPALDRWQSGVFYADGSPKSSLPALARAAAESRRGVIARCEGLELTPKARRLRPSTRPVSRREAVRFRLDCDVDCLYTARLELLPRRQVVLTRRGRLVGRALTTIAFARRPSLRPGAYRISVVLTATVNRGPPGSRASIPFRIVR